MLHFSRRQRLCLAIVAVFLIGVGYRWLPRKTDPNLQTRTDSEPAGLPFDLESETDHGYVGWAVCSECHRGRVEEFQETRHFHALKLPDQVKFPGGFEPGRNSFTPPGSPVRFDMAIAPAPVITAVPLADSTAPAVVSPVEFIYGAGAGTDEVYFTRKGDQLFEMPIAWLHHQEQWGAVQFDSNGSGDLSRPLAPQCLECHSVWVDYIPGTHNQYGPLEPELLSVTCERCHGPANEHVTHHRLHPGETVAAHILQPNTLSRDRKTDLCAQCHTNTVRHRSAPFSYRPGKPLEESFRILAMHFPEEDRVANQTRYLKESRCFQNSDTLTCITCHDPHRKPDRNDPGASNQSCRSCHQPEHCGAQTRLPDAVQGQCVNCHMPQRNKVQVNFETADGDIVFPAPRWEHRIGIYPEAEQETLWKWYGKQSDDASKQYQLQLAEALSVHWTHVADEARKSRRYVVAIDAYCTALRFGESEELRTHLAEVLEQKRQSKSMTSQGMKLKRQRRLDEAIGTFEALLKLHPEFATAEFELGTLYAATGRLDEAVNMLTLASRHDSNDPGATAMLGWLEFLADRPAEALIYYRRAAEIEPWSDHLEQMIAQCLVRSGSWEDAAQAYHRSLTIDPQNVESARGLRQILRERFSAADALPQAIQAIKVTQGRQIELLIALAEIYRDLGQLAEARQSIAFTRQVAESCHSELLPQVLTLERNLTPAK
jgi:tetratricopeptide (TPR) repeat protein